MPSGFGLAPFGSVPFGYGSVDIANTSSARALKKPDGTQGSVPLIDPETRDFVLDDTGQKVGADSTQQMVEWALYTRRGEHIVLNFGLDLRGISVFSANAQNQADAAVRLALKHLTDRKLISVLRVTLTQDAQMRDRGLIKVEWVDLRTGKADFALLPLGS